MKEKAKVYVGSRLSDLQPEYGCSSYGGNQFDVHDLARTCRTYDVARYFVIHPHESQARLVQDIIGYWRDGYGSEYNRTAKKPFKF